MSDENAHSFGRMLRETFAVARSEIIDMLKSIRFAFLLVAYAFAAGTVGSILLWANEKADGRLLHGAMGMSDAEREIIRGMMEEQGASQHLADAIVSGDLPPLVFGVLLGSTFAIPLLMLLVGFNRVSEDVTSRYTRYLLQRVHRGSYLAGKLLGHWLVSFVAIVLVHVMLLVYATFSTGAPIVEEGGQPGVAAAWRPSGDRVHLEIAKAFDIEEVAAAITDGVDGATAKVEDGAVLVSGVSEEELVAALEDVEIARFDIDSTLSAMPRIWLAMLILVLAYSAYTMMASSTLNPPILVLLLGTMLLVAIKVGVLILGIIHEPLGEIWMGSWDVPLYALDPAAIAVYLGYTAGFLAIAHLVLRRRDL